MAQRVLLAAVRRAARWVLPPAPTLSVSSRCRPYPQYLGDVPRVKKQPALLQTSAGGALFVERRMGGMILVAHTAAICGAVPGGTSAPRPRPHLGRPPSCPLPRYSDADQ